MRVLSPISLCVLLSPEAARAALPGLDENDVIALTAEHRLAPAVDIGLQSRQVLRIFPSAVDRFLAGARGRVRIPEAELFGELLRGETDARVIGGERARLVLNCSGGLINALVDDGELEIIPGTARRRGPGGSDQISLTSFRQFVKRRLM